jgi:hypothetical protein
MSLGYNRRCIDDFGSFLKIFEPKVPKQDC